VTSVLSELRNQLDGVVPAVETLASTAAELADCAKSVAAGARCIHELPDTARGLANGHIQAGHDLSSEVNDVEGSDYKGTLKHETVE
jgi:hypothetical protein